MLPFSRCLAVVLVVMYAVLSLLAAACPSDAAVAEGAHHHHGQTQRGAATHSLLCAWSCQANPSVEAAVSCEGSRPPLLLFGFVLSACVTILFFRRGATPSRAPPASASPSF
jgi:hypothetical protein